MLFAKYLLSCLQQEVCEIKDAEDGARKVSDSASTGPKCTGHPVRVWDAGEWVKKHLFLYHRQHQKKHQLWRVI